MSARNPRVVGAFLIGLGVAMWGVSLIHDPWSQERYERMVRETARLENSLLKRIDEALLVMPYVGYALMAAAFFIMNRVPVFNLLALVPPLAYGALYYSHIMFKSERFGGFKTYVGMAFTVAVASAAFLSSFATDQERHEAKLRKEEKKRREAEKRKKKEKKDKKKEKDD